MAASPITTQLVLRIGRPGPCGQLLGGQVGVLGQVDATGQTGADAELPHLAVAHVENGGGQAIE